MDDEKTLLEQLESLVKGAEEFRAEHGSVRVTIGPNSPIAQAQIERVAGLHIDVDRLTLVSLSGKQPDMVVDGDVVYYRTVETGGLTAKDVARSVGWLDSSEDVEFSSANFSEVEKTGVVYLEGRRRSNGDLVDASFVLRDFSVSPDDNDLGWDDDGE